MVVTFVLVVVGGIDVVGGVVVVADVVGWCCCCFCSWCYHIVGSAWLCVVDVLDGVVVAIDRKSVV